VKLDRFIGFNDSASLRTHLEKSNAFFVIGALNEALMGTSNNDDFVVGYRAAVA
jgi:hypothetical protein